MNDGSTATDGSPVTVTDALPSGATATAISGVAGPEGNEELRKTAETGAVSVAPALKAGRRPGNVLS